MKKFFLLFSATLSLEFSLFYLARFKFKVMTISFGTHVQWLCLINYENINLSFPVFEVETIVLAFGRSIFQGNFDFWKNSSPIRTRES